MQLPDERVPNDSKIDKDRYMLGRGGQRMYQGIMIGKGASYCHILNGTKASITYESGQGAPLWSTDIHTCDDNMHNAVAAHAGRKNKTSNDDLTDTGRAKVFLALKDGRNAAAQKNTTITHLTTYDDGGIPLRQVALPDKALDQCVGDGKNGDHFDPHDCGNCDANFMLLNAERFSEEGSRDVSKHWSTSRGVAKESRMNNFGTSSVEKFLKPVKMNMNATPSATDDIGQCTTRWACARVYAQPRGSHASTRHAFLLDGSAGCTNDSTPATVAKLFTLLSAAQGVAGQHLPP